MSSMEKEIKMNNLVWKKARQNEIDYIPNKPGVYLITMLCSNMMEYVIYSGQSNNLQRRLKEHYSIYEENEKLCNVIKKYQNRINMYYATVNEYFLDNIERYLFNYYRPQFQDRAPDVFPRTCSLPNNLYKGTIPFL